MSQQGINFTFIVVYVGGLLLFLFAFHWIIIQLFGWIFMLLLWGFIINGLALRSAIYGSYFKFVVAPVALIALSGLLLNFLFGDYWGYAWPWGAYISLGAALLIIKYLRHRITVSPYFLWWLSNRRADIYWHNWLYKESLTNEQIYGYFRKWRAANAPEIEWQFVQVALECMGNADPLTPYLLQLLPLVKSSWLRKDFAFEAYTLGPSYCFYLVSRKGTRDFLLQLAREGRAADVLAIFQAACESLDNFIAEPDAYIAPHFLKEGFIDSVEIMLQEELPKWEDLPELQTVGANFFGMHYLAVGIARNLDTSTDDDEQEHHELNP